MIAIATRERLGGSRVGPSVTTPLNVRRCDARPDSVIGSPIGVRRRQRREPLPSYTARPIARIIIGAVEPPDRAFVIEGVQVLDPPLPITIRVVGDGRDLHDAAF